jgi:hypothetical protein
MKTATRAKDATRHRLLEGALLRLARLPDAGGLVLRGGVLLRHWFRPSSRKALDLDLVSPAPIAVEEAVRRHLPLFADSAVADGVTFDADNLHVEGIWQHTDNSGVRVFASGIVGGDAAEIQVDITGGPWPRPEPVLGDLPTECGQVARVWMCRPESIVGQKLQALWQHGVHCWRPKDLADLRLLLARVPMNAADLVGAITAYLADVGGSGGDVRAMFAPDSWWSLKMSSARWQDHVSLSPEREVPTDLASVVAEVAGALSPILERLP